MTAQTAINAAAPRDWWVIAGMTTAAASAAVASFTGLRGLAEAAGWPDRLAWLLPVTIDAYAMTSARVWLAGGTGQPAARRFARANALGAITVSVAGNAAYHAIGAGLLAVTWPVIVLVGAVPATVLGLTAHLHALRSRTTATPVGPDHAWTGTPGQSRSRTTNRTGDGTGTAGLSPVGNRAGTQSRTEDRPEDGTATRPEDGPQTPDGNGEQDRTESGTRDRTESGPTPARTRTRATSRRRPKYPTEADLHAAARDADTRYRQTHGRPITRDALRAALRISGPRATELRRLLTAKPAEPHPPTTPDPTPAADAPPGDAQPTTAPGYARPGTAPADAAPPDGAPSAVTPRRSPPGTEPLPERRAPDRPPQLLPPRRTARPRLAAPAPPASPTGTSHRDTPARTRPEGGMNL